MADAPDLAGSRVGRYDVLAPIGRGGMGAVYDAIDRSLGRHVALKILPSSLAADTRRLARFVQEARAASALNHPNVVAIYEIGHEVVGSQDVHFIAMEKVEGSNLRELLAGRRLPLDEAVELLAQIVDAIAAAHAAGVVHRDLKPENIVMSRQGTPKVLDFGLAKLRLETDGEDDGSLEGETALRSTDSGVVLGTVGYMSPEQAQGKHADHRSDIFSLGCILYEAVAGRRAFAAGSSVETLNAIINAEPPPLRDSSPSAPAELQRIVSKAMEKNPDERYQSAREMALDLRAMLRSESEPPFRSRSINLRRATIAVLLAVAVLGTLAIASAVRSRNASPAAAPSLASLKTSRLTSRGTVVHAAISPDGKFVAYSLLDRTIRLRQLATGQELEVVRVHPLGVWGLTFTPDGNSIIYVAKDPQKPIGSCFRIPAIGGRSEHLFDGLDSPPAISPDGRQLTWVLGEFPEPGASALMVANIDGSGARAIAVRRPPERFTPAYFTGPSWSPDGAWIAISVQRDSEPTGSQLILVDPRSGAEKTLLGGDWPFISRSAWLSDSKRIVVVALRDSTGGTTQLWLVDVPSGTWRPITVGLASHRGISVAAQGDLLVSVVIEGSAQLWSVPLAGGDDAKISAGTFDGHRGLALMPDGRVVFTNFEETVTTLMISNGDGSGRSRLTHDSYQNRFPAVFRGGIGYVSSTPAGNEVCVTSFEGEGRRVIVPNVDVSPIAISPDGTWLVFKRNRRLWKMPMRGGTATQLVAEVASSATWSPSGDRIALLVGDPFEWFGRVAVIAAKDGRLLWSSPLSRVHRATTIRWLPDESGILVNSGPDDDQNLWRYPFDGRPSRVTNFTDRRAYFWDLSKDGKVAVIARLHLSRDAVLISGFR